MKLLLIIMIYTSLIIIKSESLAAEHTASTQELKVKIDDIVRSLEEKTDEYKVTFQMHAGIYYLKKSNKSFEKILSQLNSSKNKSQPVNLKANANTLELLE